MGLERPGGIRLTPLSGVTVLDLSTQLPGPYATMLLRSLGARVIKVEPPGGDAARHIDPAMFGRVNAGKELIELDLKTDAGRDVLHGLARSADVLVEGFRPGVVRRLAADYDTVRRHRPDIVYCSLSGFGQSGPMAGLPAHDLNLLALAGGASPHTDHRQIALPAVDLAAGTSAALAIVAALLPSPRQGVYLDLSLLDAAVVWSAVKRRDGGDNTMEPSYGVFPTSDGHQVAVAVLEDDVWIRMCEALGWSDWAADPRLRAYQARRGRATDLSCRLAETLAARPLDHWLRVADSHQLPFTAVLSPRDSFAHPQVRSRKLDHAGILQAPLPLALRDEVTEAAGGPDADGDRLRREAVAALAARTEPAGAPAADTAGEMRQDGSTEESRATTNRGPDG